MSTTNIGFVGARPKRYSASKGTGSGVRREVSPWANTAVVFAILTLPIAVSAVSDFLPVVFMAGAAFIAATLYAIASLKLSARSDASAFLFVPLLISATQNVYLGLQAPMTDAIYIQLALFTHIVFSALLLTAHYFSRRQTGVDPLMPRLFVAMLALIAFCLISTIALRASVIGMVSSARNLLTPFLFLLLGLLFAERVKMQTFLKLVSWLAWATIVVGFVEYFVWPEFWTALNIDKLWPKKGIPNLAAWGLPANFVSSELFFGAQVRRMVSSYADPVNLGTVLFLFFMVAWFTRRWVLMVGCGFAILLAISKGGLMGVLIFVFLLARYSGRRLLFVGSSLLALVAGLGVVAYSLLYSTQSLTIHAQGLWSAIATLPQFPFGRGLGGAGVLIEGDNDVRESGLGLMIGQLGIFAFLIFGVFVHGVTSGLLGLSDVRARILGWALFLGICFNIAFNEVALSPNSSAGYFMVIGLLIGMEGIRRRAAEGADPTNGPALPVKPKLRPIWR